MADKIDAILSLRPNANFGSRDDEIFWEDERPIPTDAEITAEIERLNTLAEEEKINAEARKASGKQKLLDLGLSEEEVKALIGV